MTITPSLPHLSNFLATHADIWRHHDPDPALLAWADRHPILARYVDAGGPGPLPRVVRSWCERAAELVRVPVLRRDPVAIDGELARGVPARKRRQVAAFVGCVLGAGATRGPLIDCCAGKGHVGRALAAVTGARVTMIDRDADLCRTADLLAGRGGWPARSSCVDVLSPALDDHLDERATLVALHACGDLHAVLRDRLAAQRVRGVVIAPCCYFKTARLPYRALSSAARRSGLTLGRLDLSFATCAVTVANERRRRRFLKKQAWVFAFRELRRDRGGDPDRFAQRHIRPAWLDGDFESFCRTLAGRLGVELPPHADFERAERRGWTRLARAAALERVREPFRRALEVWLVLDQARALEERGLRVGVGVFCDAAATPRNLAIVARTA